MSRRLSASVSSEMSLRRKASSKALRLAARSGQPSLLVEVAQVHVHATLEEQGREQDEEDEVPAGGDLLQGSYQAYHQPAGDQGDGVRESDMPGGDGDHRRDQEQFHGYQDVGHPAQSLRG